MGTKTSLKGLNEGRAAYVVLKATGLYDELLSYFLIVKSDCGLLTPRYSVLYPWTALDDFYLRYERDKHAAIAEHIQKTSGDDPALPILMRWWRQEKRDRDKRNLLNGFNFGLRDEFLRTCFAIIEEKNLDEVAGMSLPAVVRALPFKDASHFLSLVFQVKSVLIDIGSTEPNPDASMKRRKRRTNENQKHLPLYARRITAVCGPDCIQMLVATRSLDMPSALALQVAVAANNEGREELITGTARGQLPLWSGNIQLGLWDDIRLRIGSNKKRSRRRPLPRNLPPQHLPA